MITITISAERSEGKTRLGMIILWLLNTFTNYEVVYTETGIPYDQLKKIEKDYTRINPDRLKEEMQMRRVSIVVINTHHNNTSYPRPHLGHLHKSFE